MNQIDRMIMQNSILDAVHIIPLSRTLNKVGETFKFNTIKNRTYK